MSESKLKIWGRTNSCNVQKVLWCASELEIDYERIDAGMQFGVVGEPWFLEMNPNGRVPTIDDDGFTLWESNTIVRYLAARNDSGGMCPTDARARALAERWMDWERSSLAPAVLTVFRQVIRTPAGGPNINLVAEAVAESNTQLSILETHLAGKSYVAGEQLTIGDIPVGVLVHRWFAMLDVLTGSEGDDARAVKLPNVRGWYQRLTQSAAFAAHVMLPLS